MKYLLTLILACIVVTTQAQKAVLIFNGKDLDNWTVNGTEKWFVQNGQIVCESGPDKQYGYLSTKKSYKNFVLTLEFKQDANGNSGVFFRSSIEGVKISGWQCEVAPPGKFTGGIYESYGRGWLIKPKPEDEQWLKMGEWNTMKLSVIGDEVRTWLNGHEMIQLKDEKIGKGDGFHCITDPRRWRDQGEMEKFDD
jgi:hypothetical protein